MSRRIKKLNKDFRWEDVLNIFLAEKKALGRSETTINDYNLKSRIFLYLQGETL